MKTGIGFIFLFLSLTLCSQKQAKQGVWRGVLILNAEKNRELPFNFEIKKIAGKTQLVIHNAEERIIVSEITAKKPLKSLLKVKKITAGRNNQGRITTRHKGGGVRRFSP